MIAPADISALILAGGQGTRMGGADKGWISVDGRALVERLLAQLQAQVPSVLISANRNLDRYAALGVPVVCDLRDGYAGPLAGIEAALAACETEWLLTCPVDTLALPDDYASRMARHAPCAVELGGRLQPTFLLIPRSALPALRSFLDAGERKLGLWVEQQGLARVSFDDAPGSLQNLNDWQALQQAQQ